MKKLLLVGCAIAAIGIGYALAQTVTQQQLLGTESWQVGNGPAGPGFYTTAKAMRGGKTYALLTTGTTVTQTVSQNVDLVLVIGNITTLNLSLPALPFDQQTVMLACQNGSVTTLTVSAVGGSGQNVLGSTPACTTTSVAAMYTFVSSTPTAVPPGTVGNWYRIQ